MPSDATPAVQSFPWKTLLSSGLKSGLVTSFKLIRIIIPFYFLIEWLKLTPFLGWLGHILAPVMKLWGLPGEAGFVLVTGNFVNIYAAIAVMIPLHLNVPQITILGLMLGISHSLLVETAVLKEANAPALRLTLIRIVCSGSAGWILNRLLQGSG
jgi:spore maturation protein SpmB